VLGVADYSDLTVAGQALVDPATSASDLADIAHQHPSLRVAVVAHPKAYPGLLTWMEDLGDPAVVAAVARRRGEPSGGARSEPSGETSGATGDQASPSSTPEVQLPVPVPGPPAQPTGSPVVVPAWNPQPARRPVGPIVVGAVAVLCVAGLVAWGVMAGGSTSGDGSRRTAGQDSPAQAQPPSDGFVTPAQPGWTSYSNARYGFRLDVPTTLVPDPDPDNGEGRAWRSPDGQVLLVVSGSNDTSGGTAKQMYEQEVADRTAAGENLTYKHSADTFYVISGYQTDGREFYLARWVGAGSTSSLWWLYPTSQSATVEPWIIDSYYSFVPGDLSVPH